MATTYTETPNLGLDLYGDNDPADLRDGYNSSMRKIDSAVKANVDAIATKANSADVYTKTNVDTSQAAQDAIIATKANSADVYTKAASDTAIAKKEDTAAHAADVNTLNSSIALKESIAGHNSDIQSVRQDITNIETQISDITYPTLTGEPTVVNDKYYYGNVLRYMSSTTGDLGAVINSIVGFCDSTDYDISIPGGEYQYSSSVNLTGSGYQVSAINGRPHIVKKSSATWTITGDHIKIIGIELDGNEKNFGGDGIDIYGDYNTVSNCYVHHMSGHGIDIDGSQGKGTTADNTYMHGDENVIIQCQSDYNGGIGLCSNDTAHARILYNSASYNGLEGVTSDHTLSSQVIGNILSYNCESGGAGGISTDNTVLATISHNIIQYTQSGCPAIRFNNNAGPTSFCAIVGNVCHDNTGRGIDGLSKWNVDNCVIIGNDMLANAKGDSVAYNGNSQAPFNFPPAVSWRNTSTANPPTGAPGGAPNPDMSVPPAVKYNWFTGAQA